MPNKEQLCYSYFQVLELVCNWLHRDWPKRRIYSSQLLQKVRLGLIAPDDIKSFIGPDILGIPECSDLVNHVLELEASEISNDILAVENVDLFMTRSAITVS